jgi:hypothetical protein
MAPWPTFNGPNASLLSPTTDISLSDNVTWIFGKHTLKTGALIVRNRKDQNGRSIYTGNVSFNSGAASGAVTTGNAFADALLGNFRTYSEANDDPLAFFRFNQIEGFVNDSWKARKNLSFELGPGTTTSVQLFTQANNMANFNPQSLQSGKCCDRAPQWNNRPNKGGNRFNGLVRAGDGIPADERGRVAASDASLALVPTGAPLGFYQTC